MTYQTVIENGQPVPVDPAPLPNEDAAEMALEGDSSRASKMFEAICHAHDETANPEALGIMTAILISCYRGHSIREIESYMRLKPRRVGSCKVRLQSILDKYMDSRAMPKTKMHAAPYCMDASQNQNDPQPAKEGRLFVPTGKPVTITAEQAKELVHAIEDALVEEREAQAAALEKAVAAIEKAKAANEKLIAIRERNIEVMEILEAVLIDLNAGTLDNDRLKATLLETVKILGNIYRE